MKLLSTSYKQSHLDIALLLVRLAVGAFMLTHGIPKLEKLLGAEPISFSDPIGVSEPISLGLAVFGEAVCSVLLILGLFTRLAAFALAFTMFTAGFLVLSDSPFGKRELALIYLLVYILLIFVSPGRYSLDGWLEQKGLRNSRKPLA
jgi:putative oxidoreductase